MDEDYLDQMRNSVSQYYHKTEKGYYYSKTYKAQVGFLGKYGFDITAIRESTVHNGKENLKSVIEISRNGRVGKISCVHLISTIKAEDIDKLYDGDELSNEAVGKMTESGEILENNILECYEVFIGLCSYADALATMGYEDVMNIQSFSFNDAYKRQLVKAILSVIRNDINMIREFASASISDDVALLYIYEEYRLEFIELFGNCVDVLSNMPGKISEIIIAVHEFLTHNQDDINLISKIKNLKSLSISSNPIIFHGTDGNVDTKIYINYKPGTKNYSIFLSENKEFKYYVVKER